jgi:hypothetical protein
MARRAKEGRVSPEQIAMMDFQIWFGQYGAFMTFLTNLTEIMHQYQMWLAQQIGG